MNNQRGLTLVEITVTIGIISFVASISAAILLQVNSAKRKMSLQQQLTTIRDEFSIMILQRRHWDATVKDTTFNNATTFACLRDGTPCNAPPPPVAGNPRGFQFIPIACHDGLTSPSSCVGNDPANAPVLGESGDATQGYMPIKFPTQGFAPDGSLCSSFSLVPGNAQCPVRVDFFWRPLCATFPCTNPDVEITMRFLIRNPPSAQLPYMSEALYSREFRISAQGSDLLTVNQCVAPRTIPVGFDTEGKIICVLPQDVL